MTQKIPSRNVGLIGAGELGSGIVKRLLSLGYSVRIWDRDRKRMRDQIRIGALGAVSAVDCVRKTRMILLCLPGPKDVEAVLIGENGVARVITAGSVVVNLSTIDPETARKIANRLEKRWKLSYLDAPVSGGAAAAPSGKLTIMVGGRREVFEKNKMVLNDLGRHVYYVGETGSSAVVKIIVQILVITSLCSSLEAFSLGIKAGVEPHLLYEVLKNSSADSTMMRDILPSVLRGEREGTRTAILLKDIKLASKFAFGLRAETPVLDSLVRISKLMKQRGFTRDSYLADFSAVAESLSRTKFHGTE